MNEKTSYYLCGYRSLAPGFPYENFFLVSEEGEKVGTLHAQSLEGLLAVAKGKGLLGRVVSTQVPTDVIERFMKRYHPAKNIFVVAQKEIDRAYAKIKQKEPAK